MQKLNLTAKPAMPPNPRSPGGVTGTEMEIDRPATSGDGLRTYYITKIDELMLTVTDKRQNTRRLQVRQDRAEQERNISLPSLLLRPSVTS